MNCLTSATKKVCLILGVLSFCSFISTMTWAQNLALAKPALAQQRNKTGLNFCMGSKPCLAKDLAVDIVCTEGGQFSASGNMSAIGNMDGGFHEDFDRGLADNWIDDDSGVWSVTDKVYRMNGDGSGTLRASCYNAPFDNFAYQIDVRRMQGNLDASQGMLFRLAGNGDFYVFAIAGSGYYSAYKFDSRSGIEMISWTGTSVIKQGLKAWNTMKVVCNGPKIDFFVNNTLLKTVNDDAPYLSGMVGVFAVDEKKGDQGNAVVDFDKIKLSISGNLANYDQGSKPFLAPSDFPVN